MSFVEAGVPPAGLETAVTPMKVECLETALGRILGNVVQPSLEVWGRVGGDVRRRRLHPGSQCFEVASP